MLNIIDYYYCRILRMLLRRKKYYRLHRAATTTSMVVACSLLFIPFNIFEFLFGFGIISQVLLFTYIIGMSVLIDKRYKKLENDVQGRVKFIRKFSSSRLNRLIPDWLIVVIGCVLGAGGLVFAFISNNWLRGHEMTMHMAF